jgi:hypothetical protein
MKAGSAARSRAESGLRYLATHRGLDALRGLYAGRADDPFAGPDAPVIWVSLKTASFSDIDADQQVRGRAIATGLGFAT